MKGEARYKDRIERRVYKRLWKRQRYQIARELLGGKCAQCGSTEDLEIDHVNRKKKRYRICDVVSRRLAVLKRELKKCQLLCSDCHSVKTANERAVDEVPF